MKALVKLSHQAKDALLQTVPDPEPGDGEVIVKVHAAGVCGTDLKIFHGHYHSYQQPLIMGHELSGIVVKTGANVEGIREGARVITRTIISSCKTCRMCLSGRENLCSQKKRIGFDLDGAFAEYIKLRSEQLHVLPDEIDLDTAALTEPLAVVVHALKPVSIKPSDVVLIIGPGPIGLMTLLLCKANGASVAVSGLSRDRKRLELAKRMGADLILSDIKEDDSDLIRLQRLTQGAGADIVLECSGSAGGVNQGLNMCRAGGTYVQIGTRSEPVNVDFMKIAYKEIKTYGSIGHNKRDWDDAIVILQKKMIDVSPFLEYVCPLEQWRKGFDAMEEGGELKVIFKMQVD